MIYKFKTKYERHLEIDLTKWKHEGKFLLENIHQDRFSVPEHFIKA
jgi:hypothetical protein